MAKFWKSGSGACGGGGGIGASARRGNASGPVRSPPGSAGSILARRFPLLLSRLQSREGERSGRGGGWRRWREGGGVCGEEGGGRDVKRRCTRALQQPLWILGPVPPAGYGASPRHCFPGLPRGRRSHRRAASWGRREGGSGGGQGAWARFGRHCRLPSSRCGLWLFTFF